MSSSVSCGLVGLPNVGKSTLFNALSNAGALVANYPFATIDPNIGVVEVIDERLTTLAKIYDSEKIVPATLNIIDIAGLVEGASRGEGLGNQFLSHIRSTQAIVEVVRAFEDSSVIHLGKKSDPKEDIETINTELVLADLETISRRITKTEKLAKGDPKLKIIVEKYNEAKVILDSGLPLWTSKDSFEEIADLQLLTLKPVIYLFNLDEQNLLNESLQKRLAEIVQPTPAIFICAKLEAELTGLIENDKMELLKSYGLSESGLTKLSKALYSLLGLQSFLTAGKKEVRAWTIPKGATAPQAAGVIHGDFEKGFIAAEVVSYKDLTGYGSLSAARAAGKVRTEGKNYIVQNDDIIEFRFNVTK
jgi:hypothetical protein